jgi:hypothetical protein
MNEFSLLISLLAGNWFVRADACASTVRSHKAMHGPIGAERYSSRCWAAHDPENCVRFSRKDHAQKSISLDFAVLKHRRML